MIRRTAGRLALVLLCSAPLPALADVTARYTLAGKDALTVEVDDGGNARLGVDGKFSLITRDGVDYVAITMRGQVLVVRYADLVRLAKVKIDLGSDARKKDDARVFVLTSGASAEVAGRKGTSWTLGLKDPSPDAHSVDLVMSDDPELAPVGAVIRRTIEPVMPILEGAFRQSSGFTARISELLTRGTPLRAAPLLELTSVDRKEIDPHRFDLPGPVMSAEEFDKAADAPVTGGGTPLQPLP